MNEKNLKENLDYLRKLREENYMLTNFDYEVILDYIEKLEQENEELKADYGNKVQVERDLLKQENLELKDKIDKAIEYIERFTESGKATYSISMNCLELIYLLEILEGSVNR
jgi:uncharacterized protein YdcH (DUF465 family)